MKAFKDIEKRIKNGEHFAVPKPAILHLEAIKPDSSFVGSVVLGSNVVPVIFVKISTRTARKTGFAEGQFLQPNYKWNMIEDANHDMVGTLSFEATSVLSTASKPSPSAWAARASS